MPTDRWRVELCDRAGAVRAVLPQVTGGTLEWSTFRSVPGSGSLSWTVAPDVDIDWLTDRVRVTHIGDDDVETAFGTWLISVPGWDRDGPVTRATIGLLDGCEALNAPAGRWVTYPAGTVVTDAVAGIIADRGETLTAITPSPLTLPTALSWEPSDAWLKIANDLLDAINYDSLSADMSGRLVVAPYRAPSERPVTATYGPRREDLRMRPSWSDEADIYRLPTGARIVVDGTDEVPGMIGAADLPDAHPLSALSRGGERLLVADGEAVDQATADALAARRLDEALQVTRRVTVTHPVDGVQIGDVVRHAPLGLDAAVVQRKVRLGVGAVVEDTIRHIYTGGELPWPIR